ncbi:Ig-like domain-containing protein [Paenibacillus planticolens]|uniref:non-reducing end alpha-L-arabinofuranosidase n=1 Tax=Paenibacillus planticolens TaxID=2654976 RepID=A0ABX1ZJ13_9BACL|nr:Ig-like domain-containing protein [Paenibacillus planticolens]NOU98836.1 hypothetical protein [Paenibacillus planticolens]
MKLFSKVCSAFMSVVIAVPFIASSGTALAADPVDYQLDVNAAQRGATISPNLNGIFLEDINYAGDGGLYAELVENRSFEFLSATGSTANSTAAPLFAWKLVQTGTGTGTITALKTNPLNAKNPTYLQLNVTAPGNGVGFSNDGYDGMAIKKGDSYDFSVYVRSSDKLTEPLTVSVMDPNGTQSYGQVEIAGSEITGTWKKLTATIQASDSAVNAKLFIKTKNVGKIDFDMVSLFPQKTWKNRPGGLRADLVQMLADMNPKFLRFPGGAIVGGKNMANAYNWKNTIGDVAERPNNINFWSTANRGEKGAAPTQNQSGGLGFYEYFLMAEDLGSEPLPVVNVGMVEQFLVGGPNTPLNQIQPFIQDALDLIEYANGDITTEWGAKRAAAGHPAPFNLKYMSLGNEHWGQDYYDRYPLFYDAIKAKYPYMNLIFSTGGSADVAAGWNWINDPGKGKGRAEVMDEHYYTNASFMLNNTNRYDSYDRNSKQVFVGEYAVKNDAGSANNGDGNTGNSMKGALAEAAYMTGLERNGDVVKFASYAPTFAKLGSAGGNTYTQWWPDLIFFNNSQVYGTTSYQVQKLFSSNTSKSSYILPSTLTKTNSGAQQGVYSVVSKDLINGDIVVKLVNNSNSALNTRINLSGINAANLASEGTATELAANALTDENSLANPTKVSPKTKTISNVATQFDYSLSKYSVTVLRLHTTGDNPLDILSIPCITLDAVVNKSPKLPTSVTAILKNGSTTKVAVTWDPIDKSKFSTIGNVFIVNGVVPSTSEKAMAIVTVIDTPTITSIDPVNVTTRATVAPFLPSIVKTNFSDKSTDYLQVTWDVPEAAKYAQAGTFTVDGTVAGTTIKAKANVTVTPGPAPGTDLMLWYKFNEGSGTTVADSSSKGNNGTLKTTTGGSATWIAAGHEGSAINMNGGKIDAGTSRDLQPADITVSFWFKRTASISGEQVVAWFKPNGNYAGQGWYITLNGAIIMMLDGTNLFKVAQTPNNFFTLNEWTHVAFTFNSVTKQGAIYKNGVAQQVVVEGALNSITATSDPKLIGVSGYSDGAPLKAGVLDDFQIYNLDKSPTEVQTMYQGKQITSINDVSVTTEQGSAPVLPAVVTALYNDTTTEAVNVVWEAIDASKYAQPGTFTVNGTVAGTSIKAKANVTVVSTAATAGTITGPTSVESSQPIDLSIGVSHLRTSFTTLSMVLNYDPSKLQFDTKTNGNGTLSLADQALSSLKPNFRVLDTGIKADKGQILVLMVSEGANNEVKEAGPLLSVHASAKRVSETVATSVYVTNFEISKDGAGTLIEGASHSFEIKAAAPTVDKSVLSTTIVNAQSKYASAVEGSQPGQYPVGSKAILLAAINSAAAVNDNPASTQAQVDAAATALSNALALFNSSVITESADKTALNTAIEQAQGKLDATKEGTRIGSYPAAARTVLKAAISSAQAVYNSSSASQSQVDEAVSTLNAAVQTYLGALITLIPGETSVTVNDLSMIAKYYGTKSTDANWSLIEKADINNKGVIDIEVLAAVARMILDDWLLQN